ncbi:MAG TPA: peptidylprolyl isomerase [Vitreimonas sp.]|jgi:peptidyl-prolyl cis-trans isomerase SurA|nr:peptidylprolyl isomerase [Vitreimonas sp.]
MNWKQVSAAAILAATLTVAPSASAQLAEGVAAIVNDHVISTFDVRQRATLLLASAGLQQTPELMERAQAQALHDLVDERLEELEATKFDVTVSPEQVDRRLNDIATQNHLTADTLLQQLQSKGVNVASLRGQIHASMVWQTLMQRMYSSRVRVSETEIRDTQQRLAANASKPQYLISEIFLPANTPQELDQMQSGAMHLLEQMQHGAPFPLVARQFSQAPSAAAGGDIGWIAASELAPELQPVADRLQPGQVSLPIRVPNGIYIIAMRDRRQGTPAGASTLVTLQQIVVPANHASVLQRAQRRISGCGDLDQVIRGVDGANVVDLGQTAESDLSPEVQARINGVANGAATEVATNGDTASLLVVCGRETGGGGIPTRDEIEQRLRGEELNMLADRYLRDMRREATIITRQ